MKSKSRMVYTKPTKDPEEIELWLTGLIAEMDRAERKQVEKEKWLKRVDNTTE